MEWRGIGKEKGENTKIPRWFSLYRLFMVSRCLKNEHEKDVRNEKWLLPGSSVVVVVASSAYINLAFNVIKISKMRMPFDGKLLSFMMESFVISSFFYFFYFLCFYCHIKSTDKNLHKLSIAIVILFTTNGFFHLS